MHRYDSAPVSRTLQFSCTWIYSTEKKYFFCAKVPMLSGWLRQYSFKQKHTQIHLISEYCRRFNVGFRKLHQCKKQREALLFDFESSVITKPKPTCWKCDRFCYEVARCHQMKNKKLPDVEHVVSECDSVLGRNAIIFKLNQTVSPFPDENYFTGTLSPHIISERKIGSKAPVSRDRSTLHKCFKHAGVCWVPI